MEKLCSNQILILKKPYLTLLFNIYYNITQRVWKELPRVCSIKPKEALEKLLQEQNGQVAGAAFREDLGGIDFVWGNKDYGLERILKRREKQENQGLNEQQAKEYALNIVKSIPEVLEKGSKGTVI